MLSLKQNRSVMTVESSTKGGPPTPIPQLEVKLISGNELISSIQKVFESTTVITQTT
jgi:hypothetical protein